MNKIYKVIWNATLLAWVAVSELAKGKTKSTTSKSKAKSLSSSVIVGGIILTTPLSLIAATVQVGGGTNSGTTATASTNCADLYNYQNPENSGSGAAGNYNAGNPSVCSIAIGENAQGGTSGTGGSSGIAIGGNSKATGGLSVAIGGYAQATNVGSFALGTAALSSGFNSLAISRQAAATNNYSIAIGTTSVSKGVGSIAMGHSTNASGDQSIAIGSSDAVNSATATTTYDGTTNTQASGSKSIAIGASAKASTNNSIALGAGSVTSAQSGNSYLTGVGASATNGVVSVGTSTATRRIQNVADGSAASDAVTVAQLDKAYDDTNGRLAAALGTGSGAAYNAANNTYTAPTNIGGTGKNTIDDAIKATQRSVVAGSNIVVTPTTASDGSISYSVATSATPTFTSITVNNAPTAGTDATNKTYVDSKAAASRTEVAAGSNVSGVVKTTGANGQDVYTVNANGTTASAGSSAVTVTPGTKDANNVTDYKVDLSATTKTDIQKGVDAKNAVDTAGLKFKGDTATTSNTKKLGDTVSITGDTNISTVATTDGVQVKLNPNLDLGATGSVKTGNTTINNAGVTADQVTVGGVVINNTSGINAGGKAITNVAAPTNNTDAANKKYVDDAGTALTNLGFGLKAQDGTTVNKKLGEAVDIVGSNSNISTKVNAGKVEVALSNTLDLGTTGSVTTGSTVINNAGVTATQVTANKVTINNAPTAGTDATNKTYVDSKAAASRTEVAAGSNVSGVVKTTGANGQDIYTVNANGTTASAGSSAVTVTPGTKDANNVTDYKVDLSATTKTDIQKGVDAKNAVDTAGLKFKGDTATTSNTKKLGDTVSITGDTNISTVATTDGVQVKLNPNLDLGATGSVKTGNTTINNAGVTADQVTVGGVVINNTSGINAGGKAITNVAAPTNNTDAANKKYVDDAGTALTNLGFGLKAQDGTTVNKKLGEAVDIVGSNSNISTKVNAGKVEVALSNTLDLGTTGSVTTGSTVINNAGVTATQVTANKVTVNNAPTAGTDATNKTYVDSKAAASRTEVAAGSNVSGVVKTTGANGQDVYTVNANGTTASAGSSAVTVTPGTKDANNVTDYKVDLSATTKTDIQKGVDAKNAVDTAGLKFKGDTATTSNTKKLGDTVSITGDTNISTVATTDGVQVKLNPNLDLGATGSVKTGNTTINNVGVTADQVTVGGVVINNTSGINAGGKAITNVAAPTNNTDAANKKYVDDAGTALTNLGFGLKAQDGTTVNKKLGEAVEVVGADSNITTKVAGGQVAIELNKNLNNLTGITVNDGTNGTNGSTVIGKDGISVKDGSGNTIAGVDNTALTVKDGSGNTETSINQAINTLNAAQGETDKFAVKYDKNADGSVNYNNVTLAGTNGTTISNVKAGAVTSTSTDAINGSQLYGVANSVKNAIGGSTTIDATTGAITTTNIGGTGSNTIDGAISSIKDSATKAKTTVSAGDNVVVTSGTNADGSTNYEVATAKDVNFDKVTVGSVVVDKSSNTIKGLSNTTWNGTAVSGQAATEDQLKTVSDAQGETDKFAVKYDKNADGSANYNNITLAGTTASSTQDATTGKITTTGGTSLNNVASAGDYKDVANASKGVNAGDLNNAVVDATNAATSKGFALQAADGAKVQKNLGEAVEVVGADSNITTKVVGGQVAIELNKNLNNLTGITVNDGTNGTNGSTVIGKDGISVKDGSGNTIAGVDNTALTVKDGSGNTETSINQAINTLNAAQGETDKFAVKYDKNTDGSTNYNSITAGNGNGTAATIGTDTAGNSVVTSGGTKISNVANGVNASDAVNKGQLDSLSTGLTNTGFGLKAADGNTVNKKLGEAVDVVGADSNITTKVAGGQVAIELNKNLNNLTGITVNDGTNGTNGSTVIGKDGISVKDGSGNTIAGVDNTALTVKDGSGNTETSINQAINTLNAAQGETDKFAVKYDKNADGSANYNNITLAGTTASSTQDATTGKITTTGGTSLNNVASAGDYKDVANASKGVNAGDLNNAVVDATNAATSKGFALQAADGAKVQKNLGEAVEVVGADSNITTKVAGGQVAIELNKNLNNLTGITVNDGTNGANGSTVIGKDGISVKDGSGNTIAGVDNTALTVKDGSGNTETSINKAINTLNAAQGETDKFAVKYDKNADGSANYNNITLAGTTASSTQDATTGKITTTGGTSLNNVASAGDYKDVANASKGVNAGDLNNAVVDATNAATSKGFALQAADGAKVQKNLGEAVEVVGADSNITTKVAGGQVAIELNKNLNNLTGITVNDGTNGANGSTVIGKDGISVKDGSGNTIAGVDNTALTVKDGSGNTETSINKAINTLNAAQGETDKFAVKYDKNADGSANYNNITLAGTSASSTQDATTGKITTTGGTSLNNVASAGDYKDVANASKGVNAGDLNNAVVDATNAATSKGFALQAADGAKVQKNLGEAVEVVGADSNITTKVAGGQVAIELNKNLNNLTGITVNDGTNGTNGSTVIGKDGISVKDGSGNTIAGVDNTALTVKDGSGNTETSINQAINTLNAAQGETDKFAVKYDKNTDGSTNYNSITAGNGNGTAATIGTDTAGNSVVTSGGTKISNVANGINASDAVNKGQLDSLSTGLTNTGFGLKAADGNTVNKKLGEAVDVVGADSNITTKVAGGQVAIELNKNLNNLTGITVNDGTNGTNGSTVIGKDGISVKDGSGNTIAGVDNTALTVKDGSGNTETSINQAINTLNAAQGETDKFAVKYDKNADGSANYNNITLAGTSASSTQDATTGKITTTGGTSLNNVASAGDYKDVANASKGVNAGDLNNAVVDATNAATSKGFALQAADGAKVQKNLGEAVEVVGADSNITTKVAGGQVAIELNKNLNNLTGITVNDGTSGTNGSTVIGKDGISVKDGSGNTIAGVDNTALTVKDGSGNTETSINQAINTLNAAQGETDKFAVKYDKNADGSANYNNITLAGTTASSTQDATTGKITTTGGTSLNNVASAGDYKDVANASKGVNAGDLNNAVVDATNAATSKGFALQAADGAKVQKNLGEAVEVVGADSNITTKVAGGQVAIELNKNLNNLTGITVNDGTNGTNGSTVIGKDGISVKDGSGNTIAGVDNTALTVKDGSGNTETSINQAINTLNAAQGETDKFAVKYDKNADGSVNYNNVTLAGTNGTIIRNVKAGAVTSTSTDAINGSQLYDIANSVKNAIGGSTTIDATTGAITTTNIGGTGSNTIDGAISSIKDSATKAKTTVSAGDNVVVTSGTNADGSTNYEVATAKDVNFDKVTVGSVVVDKSSNTIKGLSNTTWNGTAVSGQAATEDQLKMVSDAQGETDKFAVKYDKNADGSANYNNITLAGTTASSTQDVTTGKITTTGGTSLNNVASAGDYKDVANASKGVNAGDLNNAVVDATNAATSKGFALQAADGAKVQKNLGEAVDVVGADSNITTKVAGGQVAIELNKNLNNLTGITVNDGTNGTNGSTVIGKDGISVKDGSGNTIAGVDNTALTVKDGSGNTETSINQAINTLNAAQGETDKFAVKYDKNADGSANYNNITLAGTTASSTQDATTGKITTTGGTSLNNVASAGDYKDVANASKGVNAGDLNNAVVDATNAATSKGFALQAADGAKVQKNLGEAVEVVGADSNITTKVAGGQVAIELNKNLNNLTGITVNDGTNGTNGSTVIGKDGISVKDGSGNTIAGVDNTALTVKDGSGNTETSINQAINTLNAAQGETDKFAVKYDKNADGSVNYNNVTLAGTNGTIIRNVKAGAVTSTSTDAINGSQLYDVANSVKNAIGGSTTRDVTTGAITTTNIGGTGSNTIDGAISSIKDSATKAKTTVSAGDNVVVTSGTNADGSTNYEVATAKDVNFDKVTVGNVVVDKANDTIQGLSNKDLNSSDFATKGRAATEEQLKAVITSNITEVVDGNGNKVNIIDQVVNTKPDNKNQDSLFLTYDKQGQETTDRLTIGQTVQKMNTDGIKFFHTNADTSKGDLGTTNDSSAGGLNSTAIGVNAIVANGADSSVALGHNTKVNGKQSIAIGSGAEALGNQSISIGTGNKVTGDHSGAIGDPTIVNGANSYSVGNNNQVLTDDTFVLGNNVTKTVAGSVVLGNGSAATTGAGEAGYALSVATNADKAAITKTTSSTGAVAVGDASSGIYRQITGVAAGSVDSDAVNVAQLKAVGNQVVTTQTTLVNSLGGNAKVNADGTITGPTYNVAQGNQTNVGDALTALDNAINTAATTSKSTVSNGQNIVVSKSKNADGSDNYEVSTAKDLTVDSVKAGDTVLNNAGITIGNNAVVLNNTGLTISGGPSVTLAGIDAGNKTIQNVANAVNATDAVNKGQLDSAINNVNNNVNELANNAVKYDDASKDKITLGGGATGTTITNVKDGTVAQGSKDAVNGGQLWNVQQQVDQNTTDISNIKNDINNGTVGLVQQAGKDAPVTVAKDTGGTTVNVAGTDGNRVVTGVKEGAVNATSKDAVNGSQLNTTNQAVVNYLGGGAGYDNITGSFTAPSYTVGDSKYNNVGGAIDALNQADQALNSKIDNVSNKLDNAFRITNNRIDDVEKKANAGIAAAMALESAPYVPGKYTYAAGAAYHGGENAVGVTLRKTADNGRWSITGGVAAASQGDASVRIGISGVID